MIEPVEDAEKVKTTSEIEDSESNEEEELACKKCAFVGKTSAGLKTHETTKHRNHKGGKSLFTIV